MFQNAYGDSTWAKGLRYYVTERAYNYSTPEHLYAGLQESVDEDFAVRPPDIAIAMRSWETQSGFPYITVTRAGSALTFEQNRFMYSNRNSTNLWWVPINYVVGSNPDFSRTQPDFWLPNVQSLTLLSNAAPKPFADEGWIIVNIQETGLYRVNYDSTLWSLIVEQLNAPDDEFEKIHLFNRAQLIDDSFNLARADIIDYNIVFEIMNYLEKETDYIPWASTITVNTLLNRRITGTNIHPRYQAFMRKNVAALFERLGTSNSEHDHRVDRYARNVAINIACQNQLPECLSQTTERLQTMIDEGTPIEPDLITAIYCNGMRTAGALLFASMGSKLIASTVQADRHAIISGMACTQNQELFRNFLFTALNEESLTSTERTRFITSGINTGEASIRTMLEFLSENTQEISNYGLIGSFASSIASRIHSSELYADFISLLDTLRTDGFIGQSQFDTYTAAANSLLVWQNDYISHVLRYFESVDGTTPGPTAAPTTLPTTPAPSTTTSTTVPPVIADTTTPAAGSVLLPSALVVFAIVARLLA